MIVFSPQTALPPSLPKARVSRLGWLLGKALRYRNAKEVGVRFVSEAEMQRLNKTYRGKNRPTDVLSFGFLDSPQTTDRRRKKSPVSSLQFMDYLGDLAVCLPYAKREAARRAIPISEEAIRLLTHGVLHLAGYDHATEKEEQRMFAVQERIVEQAV